MRALVLCIALTLLSALSCRGADLLILQSGRGAGYAEALRGFASVCSESARTVVLSDYAEVNVVRLVKEERPRVVVVLGDKALAAARKIHDVPVVACLALSLNPQRDQVDNIGGVSMVASPQEYLKVFTSLGAKRIGVVYDRSKTGRYVNRMVRDARQQGVTVVAEPVSDAHEMQGKLQKLAERVDALWLLPDSTVTTDVNVEAALLFSMKHNLPLVTFSSYYLKRGAAASVDIDHYAVGEQAGAMATSLMESGGRRTVGTVEPGRVYFHSNENVLRKLRLSVLRLP